MRRKIYLICWLLFAGLACISCQADNNTENAGVVNQLYSGAEVPQKLPTAAATLGGVDFQVMLARSDQEKAKGLMYFDSLADNEAMLFVYPSPRQMSFWMLNTKIPLDLIFLSDQLVVTEFIESMQPGYGKSLSQLPRYVSQMPAQYALEVKAGTVKKLGISPGDSLVIPVTLLYSE